MNASVKKVLLIGYGNPGRLDDGLGPALADAIAHKYIPHVTVESNYLLTVEDAAQVAEHDIAIFADASVKGGEPFYFRQIEPKLSLSFSSHHIEPEMVLGLAHDLFQAKTKGYVLGIQGYEFNEFGQRLSAQARENLLNAIEFIEPILRQGDFDRAEQLDR